MTLTGEDYVSLTQKLDWASVTVASVIPGRIRLRSDQLRGDPSLSTRVREALLSADAITDVSVRARTGSVLVHYETDELGDLPALIDRAASVGMLPDDIDPAQLKTLVQQNVNGRPHRDFTGEVRGVFRKLNASVSRFTGGSIDLKGLAPLTLLGLGVRRVLSSGPLERVPWFNYFWFALTLFLALDGNEPEELPASGSSDTTTRRTGAITERTPAQP